MSRVSTCFVCELIPWLGTNVPEFCVTATSLTGMLTLTVVRFCARLIAVSSSLVNVLPLNILGNPFAVNTFFNVASVLPLTVIAPSAIRSPIS